MSLKRDQRRSTDAESKTNEGRIDAYIRTANNVYLFEFKLDRKAKAAIDQIGDHHYYDKFLSCNLPIIMVGVSFDSKKGQIKDWNSKCFG